MGSIEVYDTKTQRWLPYVADHKKWEQHFMDLAEGRDRMDHKGRSFMGSGDRWTSKMTPRVDFVTPIAQTEKMVKSEIASPKVIRRRKKRKIKTYID